MNELIEEILRLSKCEPIQGNVNNISLIYVESFKQAIQTACEAQRNACVRDFNNYAQRHEYSNNCARVILKAKIERQDYE